MKAINSPYLDAVEQARNGLKAGDVSTARHWAIKAASLDATKEDPWLILAAVSSPRASVEYLNKALTINPDSLRARKGMAWAQGRISQSVNQQPVPRSLSSVETKPIKPSRNFTYAWFMLPAFLMLGLIILISYPVIFSTIAKAEQIAFTQNDRNLFVKTPTAIFIPVINPERVGKTDVASSSPTPPVVVLENLQSPSPTPLPDQSMLIASLPIIIISSSGASPNSTESIEPMQVTPFPVKPVKVDPAKNEEPEQEVGPDSGFVSPNMGPGVHWVDVDLSQQMAYAFEGDQIVNSFVVSTGRRGTPTVTGKYKIYVKYRSANMSGPGYFLPDVPYVMYFYKGYGLHGTYWHHNFGTPMSHGCVNFKTKDAKWIFDWASVGTVVNVHK